KVRVEQIHISQYFESSQCMLLTIRTQAHEQLHRDLCFDIAHRLNGMGLGDSFNLTGGVTCYSQGFHSCSGNGSAGGASSSIWPLGERNRRFPTLMIEAGCSWSLVSMRAKAEWWFQVSNHNVKIVLLAKFDESQNTVVLERWQERQREHAGDEEAEWVASCQQTITISETEANPQVYRVTGGELVLDLRLLLLKSPPQGEEYVVLTVEYLQRYARPLLERRLYVSH
ncbi:uncharacterized protein TRIVIDRAFT_162346, partial [Trichoderma virens Gv29-8]